MPFPYGTYPAVRLVNPVPPLATGKAVPDKVIANVPLVVIGLPDIDKKAGTVAAIEVTVPLPLLLKVVQSAELKTPRLVAEAVGTLRVITGVVVPVATVELKSVPVVPKVSAATLVTVPKFPVKATPLALKTPVEGTKLSFVELVVIGKLPVVVDTSVGYHVALELVLSVTATFVAFVAVVAVVALEAEPLILTAKEVIEPLAAFKTTAVVPIYSVELPKTALGIVPVRFPAVRLVRLAPEPLNPVAVKTPLKGLY